jgi:hypothetical protein
MPELFPYASAFVKNYPTRVDEAKVS